MPARPQLVYPPLPASAQRGPGLAAPAASDAAVLAGTAGSTVRRDAPPPPIQSCKLSGGGKAGDEAEVPVSSLAFSTTPDGRSSFLTPRSARASSSNRLLAAFQQTSSSAPQRAFAASRPRRASAFPFPPFPFSPPAASSPLGAAAHPSDRQR